MSSHLDEALGFAVRDALDESPDIDALTIDVWVGNGRVRLGGTVGSYAERVGALELARGIPGVSHVENDVVVRGSRDGWSVSDHEIAGGVAEAIKQLSTTVDVSAVEFGVSCHVVELRGSVPDAEGRTLLRHVVEIVPGVDFVINEIEVRS